MRKFIAIALALIIVLSLIAPAAMATTEPTETGSTEATVVETTAAAETTAPAETEAAPAETEAEEEAPEATDPVTVDNTAEVLAETSTILFIFMGCVAVLAVVVIVLIIVKKKALKDDK